MAAEDNKNQQALATDEEILTYVDHLIAECREKPGIVIPLLQITQKKYGYLPEPALRKISHELHIPYSEVAGIVGFYAYFSIQAKGKNVVRVCQGTACHVLGGNEVFAAVKKELKIDVGETTPDGQFSLAVGRCFGACGMAPVIMVNGEMIQQVKPSQIKRILRKYKK
ncbi:MAG: NAD(P)H-dependent oxidoreductase subunit E [Bacteroidota bacterium]|nr:NAD(P)H-dependent oxidoreductase subunit E [Bacteroidota bacterium]